MLRKWHWLHLSPLKFISLFVITASQTVAPLLQSCLLGLLNFLLPEGWIHQPARASCASFDMTCESPGAIPNMVQLHTPSLLASCTHAGQALGDMPAPPQSHGSVPVKGTLQGLTGLWNWPRFLPNPCLHFPQQVTLNGSLFLQKCQASFFISLS